MTDKYTIDHSIDGWPIVCDGFPIPKKVIIQVLNQYDELVSSKDKRIAELEKQVEDIGSAVREPDWPKALFLCLKARRKE